MPPSKEQRRKQDSRGIQGILRELEETQEQQKSGSQKQTPTWNSVQETLGNQRINSILAGESTQAVDLYLRHLLQVEREEGLDTSPYLPWNAPLSWTEWIRPYYGALETHLTEQSEEGDSGLGSAVAPAAAPELLSQDAIEKLTSEDAFMVDWFNRTLKRAGSGRSPTPQERSIMEQVHGPLPKGMKIHEGDAAREAAQGVQAKAFTLGTDIYFSGRADASTAEGAELLVHEATHVKQAVEGRLPNKKSDGLETSSPSDPHEQEAYAAGAEGRDLVAKKASWGLDSVGEIDPAGAAVLNRLGEDLPEVSEGSASREDPAQGDELVSRAMKADFKFPNMPGPLSGVSVNEEGLVELKAKRFDLFPPLKHTIPPGAPAIIFGVPVYLEFSLGGKYEESGGIDMGASGELFEAASVAGTMKLDGGIELRGGMANVASVGGGAHLKAELGTKLTAGRDGVEFQGGKFALKGALQASLKAGPRDIFEAKITLLEEEILSFSKIDYTPEKGLVFGEFKWGPPIQYLQEAGEKLNENIAEILDQATEKVTIAIGMGADVLEAVACAGINLGAGVANVLTPELEWAIRDYHALGGAWQYAAPQTAGYDSDRVLLLQDINTCLAKLGDIVYTGRPKYIQSNLDSLLEVHAYTKTMEGSVSSFGLSGWDYPELMNALGMAGEDFQAATPLDCFYLMFHSNVLILERDPYDYADEKGQYDIKRIRSIQSNLNEAANECNADPVQQKSAAGKNANETDASRIASEGLSGAGAQLPHAEKVQESFGKHDIGHIRAAVGGDAGQAAADIGAKAYATGDKVAFQSGQANLHTSAHEAAHVVQQRSGKVPDGVGQAGDRFEKHADAVADKVVAGESAEPLLNEMAGTPSTGLSIQLNIIQRKEGGGGSSHSGTLSGLTGGISATSSAGLGTLEGQSAGEPNLSNQSATEDRASKRDKFEDGVDANLDNIEDYSAFDDLIEAIEDDESTSSDIRRLERTQEFKQLAQQWQSAIEDKKDGAKLRSIFNNEYDGRGFWSETEQAFALVANAAKRAATPDPNSAGAEAALSNLEGAEELTPQEGGEEKEGGGSDGKGGGSGPGQEGISEAVAALLDVAVPIAPEPLESYQTMETLQTDYNDIHSAFGSRETFSEQAEIQANERGRVGEVFETMAESFGSGFLQGALEGTVDAVVWDTLTSAGDSFIKNQTKGQMPPVIGPAYSLITSFGLYPGAEFDPTAGIGGDNGDLAKMGDTFGDMKANYSALFSGEYSGTDRIGIMVAALADTFQMIKQVLDLVSKVLGILSALLYVIAGVLIALGLAFCWCGMGFLIPIGNQLIPIGTMLGNFCKLLAPITLALGIAIPILRAIAAIMVPQEMYAKQLDMTAAASEKLGSSTGSKIADATVENAKDRIATRNVPVGTGDENPATEKQKEGNTDGQQLADDLTAKLAEGEAALDTQKKNVEDSPPDNADPETPKKSLKDDAIDIAKAALNPKNLTESFSKPFAPLKKLKDPNYWNGTDLKQAYDRSSRIHEQEIGLEARKKVLEDDLSNLESARDNAYQKIEAGETDLVQAQADFDKTTQQIESMKAAGSGSSSDEISHFESVKSFHAQQLTEAKQNYESAETELGKVEKKIYTRTYELESIKDRPTDRSHLNTEDLSTAKEQVDSAQSKVDQLRDEYQGIQAEAAAIRLTGNQENIDIDLATSLSLLKKAELELDVALSTPMGSKYAVEGNPKVTAAQEKVDGLREQYDLAAKTKEQAALEQQLRMEMFNGLDELGLAERELANAKAEQNHVESVNRQKAIDGTTNSRNNEKVITGDGGKEIGRRRKKGSGSPSKIIAGMLKKFQTINYLKTNDGDKLLWAPDTGQQSPEELQNLPTLEPALAKVYRGVGSEAFFAMMAEEVPLELDTLAQNRENAEIHMQRHIAFHFDAYMAYQSEREAKANIDSKNQFLSTELQPAGDLIDQQGPELKSAESSAKERQSKLGGVNPEVGKADPGIADAGKKASEGVKEGEDDMKDKPDSGATTAGASDAGSSVDDADSATEEGKSVVSGGSEQEVSMMGEMIGVHAQIGTTHSASITGMETKIAEDEAGLQEIKVEKATRLDESNTERALADSHATAYNESTTTLTEWAIKYQEDRGKVHSLNSSA